MLSEFDKSKFHKRRQLLTDKLEQAKKDLIDCIANYQNLCGETGHVSLGWTDMCKYCSIELDYCGVCKRTHNECYCIE